MRVLFSVLLVTIADNRTSQILIWPRPFCFLTNHRKTTWLGSAVKMPLYLFIYIYVLQYLYIKVNGHDN